MSLYKISLYIALVIWFIGFFVTYEQIKIELLVANIALILSAILITALIFMVVAGTLLLIKLFREDI